MKYFFYIDESGRDPFSEIFIVSVLITTKERHILSVQLRELERTSKKGLAKWSKADWRYRRLYINGLTRLELLSHSMYFHLVRGSDDYLKHTADATVNVIKHVTKGGDQATMFFDGFTKTEVINIKRHIRPSFKGKNVRVIVKAIRRDESSEFIRLADAMCGLIRDADEGHEWSQKAVGRLKRRELLTMV